jgi:DNA-binding response OmpR family regulator
VVVLSGSGSGPVRQAAMNAGADAFVEKPFSPTDLALLVDGLLSGDGGPAVLTPAMPGDTDDADPITVLVAEDDDLVAALVLDRLARDGFQVLRAMDGESALAAALASPPRLAILDVMMPKMNGFEVLGRLRSAPQTAEVPVIILTGRGREEDVIRGFDLGATDYIVKPFSPAELAVRVRRHTSPS